MNLNRPILIVNPNAVILNELQQVFESQGCKVIATTNSLMAVHLFFQHKPRVVILNVSMPHNDGFEITKEIRKSCQETFILAMSGNHFYLRAIKKLGANEALPHWTSPAELSNIIDNKLNSDNKEVTE